VIIQGNSGPANFGGGVAVPVPAGPLVKGGVVVNDTGGGVGVAPDVAPFGTVGGSLWPKMVATWSVLSVLFLALSVQLVSPTRRWRPNLRRRGAKGIAA
jgi:hypothetical protein